jgi:hypothetical protein
MWARRQAGREQPRRIDAPAAAKQRVPKVAQRPRPLSQHPIRTCPSCGDLGQQLGCATVAALSLVQASQLLLSDTEVERGLGNGVH